MAALEDAAELLQRMRRDGPWESMQTHQSLLPYLIEESWELADAVAASDRGEMRSELGDVLLQVLFHSAIAAEHENDPFDANDVANTLIAKLRQRMPFFFTDAVPGDAVPGDVAPENAMPCSAAEQDATWQANKALVSARDCVLDGIPPSLPALALIDKVLDRLDGAGFPADLIDPLVLNPVVSLGSDRPEQGSELRYREQIHKFMDRVAVAEKMMAPAQLGHETHNNKDDREQRWRQAWRQ